MAIDFQMEEIAYEKHNITDYGSRYRLTLRRREQANGIGSRFGKGIKQLAPVGPKGEIIMDYSIHDAIEAGFNKSM